MKIAVFMAWFDFFFSFIPAQKQKQEIKVISFNNKCFLLQCVQRLDSFH